MARLRRLFPQRMDVYCYQELNGATTCMFLSDRAEVRSS